MAAISNTYDKLIQRILARGLMVLRKKVLMTRLVNTDYKNEARRFGETIDIPYSTKKTATDVTPSNVPSNPTDQTTYFAQVTIDKWQKADFGMTDNDMKKINKDQWWLSDQMIQSVSAIAEAVNSNVFSKYTGVYGTAGTAGTTPFGSGVEVKSATDIRKVLNQQLCPKEGRNAVLNWDAEAEALALAQFSSAETTADQGMVKIEGEIGKKFGIYWNADSDVPTHTSGTGATTGVYAVDNSGGYSAEPTLRYSTVHIDTASASANSLVAGDIITFAGHTQTYAVTTGISLAGAGEGDIVVSPGLQAAVADDAAITRVDDHVVNLVFHRDAFGLAMRSPDMGMQGEGDVVVSRTMGDELSGIILRLEKIRLYKQVMWEFDSIWGSALIRPEFAARLLG